MEKQGDAPSLQRKHPYRYLLNWRYLIVIAFCILLNYGLSELASLQSSVPLYLDTVGTIISTLLAGPLPGILVGIANNLLNCIIDPLSIYYACLSIYVSFITYVLASKGFFKKWYFYPLISLIYSCVCGPLSGLLSYTLYDQSLGSGVAGVWAVAFNKNGMSALGAEIFSSFLADLIDKLITVCLIGGFVACFPKVWKHYFKDGPLYRKEFYGNTYQINRKSQENKKAGITFSLKSKIVMTTLSASLVIAIGGIWVFTDQFVSSGKDKYATLAKDYAVLASKKVNGNLVNSWLNGIDNTNKDSYDETVDQLQDCLDSAEEIKYIYVYKIAEENCVVVFDLDPDGDALGDKIQFDEGFLSHMDELRAGKAIDNIETNDKFGWLMTSYQPILDSSGTCVAYAGVDVSLHAVSVSIGEEVAKTLSIIAAVILVATAFSIYFSDTRLTAPTYALVKQTKDFQKVGAEHWLSSDEWKNRDEVMTNDELEQLYLAICRAEEQASNDLVKIKEQGRTISKMERNIVYALADMVESRDENTGDHIRRTSLYVKMVSEELYKEGKFKDILTKQYISDLVLAAPLHDIGKIKVSDRILNKSGKLTPEEFDIMKTHVSEGAKILQNAMEGMLGQGYIKLAKEVAEFHHEKYDGTGYMKGLKGEEIPLSARIMAIADVFDALVSKRSYKEPFTFEAAVSIIKEERGTHFDPVVTNAFLNILSDIKASLDKKSK